MEKRKPSGTIGGNEDWCKYCGKQYGDTSNKLKMDQATFLHLHKKTIPFIITSKKNKIPSNKAHQGFKRPVLGKLRQWRKK